LINIGCIQEKFHDNGFYRYNEKKEKKLKKKEVKPTAQLDTLAAFLPWGGYKEHVE